jgi:hypothetical protein
MLEAISLPFVDTLLPHGFPARRNVVQTLASRLVVALSAGRNRLVHHR